MLNEINQIQNVNCLFTENTVEVNGVEVVFSFGKNAVQIKDSYRIKNRAERLAVLKIIRNELQERELSNRSITSMEGEWVLHNMVYRLGERNHSPDVDLDYNCDSRWYVALLSEILGRTGL